MLKRLGADLSFECGWETVMMDENAHERDAKPCEIFPVLTSCCLKLMYS